MANPKTFKKPNLDEIRKKYQNITQPREGGNTDFFQTNNGTYVIRLLPSIGSSCDPFTTVYYHKGLGAKRNITMVCPRTHDRPCALCEYRMNLLKTKDAAQAEIAKRYKNKSKSYCNILVKGYTEAINPGMDFQTIIKEAEYKVFVYGLHWTLYQELLGYLANPMYGDITDIKEGRDFIYVIAENKSSGYRDHKLTPFPDKSPASDKKEMVAKIQEMMGNLEIFKKEISYEGTKKLLDETLYGEFGNVGVQNNAPAPSAVPAKEEKKAAAPAPANPVPPAAPAAPVAPPAPVSQTKMKCFGQKYSEVDPVLCLLSR